MGKLLSLLRARFGNRITRRFGDRYRIDQPGVLEISGCAVFGTIRDVGLGGVYFAGPMPRKAKGCGVLSGPDGRQIPVEAVWTKVGPDAGAGLRFIQ